MFETPLILRAHVPGEWVLFADLVWKGDMDVTVPRGFITDLASIPRLFRNILDVNGRSRRAAVLHDWLYCVQSTTREEADLLFLQALQAEQVGWLSHVYYRAVRLGGRRAWGNRLMGVTISDFADPSRLPLSTPPR